MRPPRAYDAITPESRDVQPGRNYDALRATEQQVADAQNSAPAAAPAKPEIDVAALRASYDEAMQAKVNRGHMSPMAKIEALAKFDKQYGLSKDAELKEAREMAAAGLEQEAGQDREAEIDGQER